MNKIILAILIAIFISFSAGYAADKKDELKEYVSKINPILINVQVTSRNISQKTLSLEAAIKQMRGYIAQLRAVTPPTFMKKQHDMILLSFQKMKAGFFLLSKGDRVTSIPLVRRGAGLLKIAINDVVDFLKREGLMKNSSGKGDAK